MGIFGWSLPPGCGMLPGEEERAVQLDEDKCLKGYGKPSHGLCGKDADLDAGGQIVVTEAFWIEDDTVTAKVGCYATLAPGEEWTEEQNDSAQETILGSGYPGEWTGDDWILTYDTSFKYTTKRKTEEGVIAELYRKIMADKGIKGFREEMAGCSAVFNEIDDQPEGT